MDVIGNLTDQSELNFFAKPFTELWPNNQTNIVEMDVIGNSTDQSEFAEPFTELWKKLLGTIAFMVNSIGCVIMLTFVGLERQGFGSYYRTALNQINSWILIFVSQLDTIATHLRASLN